MAKSKQKQAAPHSVNLKGSLSSNGGGPDVKAVGFPHQLLKSLPPVSAGAVETETLIPNAMFVMHNALTSAECNAWIAYAEENNGKKWDMVSHPATKYIAHRE
jgi:hypothetical protein